MRNKWTASDLETLKECYKSYPFILSNSILERHGRAGCHTKAERMGLSHKLRAAIPDISSWSETTKAYLAGIIDGEGTITIIKNNRDTRGGKEYVYSRPVVTISNTDYLLLDFLTSLNLGGFSSDTSPMKPHWKQAFQWALSSVNSVYVVLKAIHPYLIIKKAKAEYVMAWIEAKWSDESTFTGLKQKVA